MSVLKTMAIGFMIMAAPTWGTDSPKTLEMNKKVQIQILKDTSHIMIQEFKFACEAYRSEVIGFKPAPAKPEGYSNNVPYYTMRDKIGWINDINKLLEGAPGKVQKIINDIENEEDKNLYSNEKFLKIFREIFGILYEGRKTCSMKLPIIQSQETRIQTLKESQEALKNCQADLMKKKPSRLSQAKNFVGLGKKKTQDTSSTPSPKKEINPDERQKILMEALHKSGLM